MISFLFDRVSNKDQSNVVVVNLSSQPDTLFYDGECPICQREVALLRKRKTESLKLVDVHRDDSLTAQQREQLTNRLHVLCANGAWLTGYQANLQAWKHTDLNRWVPLLNVLPIRKLGEVGYELWLRLYRYLRKRRRQRQSMVRKS